MDNEYICKECGFSVREIELEDWSRHVFVNVASVAPDIIPEYDLEKNCENFEAWEEELA